MINFLPAKQLRGTCGLLKGGANFLMRCKHVGWQRDIQGGVEKLTTFQNFIPSSDKMGK